jgi:general L-amino acid transport system permease protein
MSTCAPAMTALRSRSALARQALGWAGALLLVLVALQLIGAYLRARGMPVSFGFMGYPAGFDMSESVIRYSGDDTYARALLAGGLNTL